MLASIMNTVNGVDVEKLFKTIDAIKEDPSLAKFNFKAKNRWINGGHNSTIINEYYGGGQAHIRNKPFSFEKDEPPILLGQDGGANPVEYALTALIGCLTTSLVYHASAKGIKIDEIESTLEGNLDLRGFLGMSENVRNGYENIQINFKIKSDAPEEKLQELIEVAKKRSPVFDIVSNPTPVKVKIAN